MPTKRKDRNGQWLAKVYLNGEMVASKMFPPGRKGGPEWRAAKTWEEEQKKAILENRETLSTLNQFNEWLSSYVKHCRSYMTKKEADEKASFLAAFSVESLRRGLDNPQKMTPQFAHEYLSDIKGKRGPNVANRARKHLIAAWNWGYDFIDDFPDKLCPFRKVRPFPVKPQDRYVPSDEDIIKVLNLMTGQDSLMVAAYLQTGARKTELFRLTWDDVDLTHRRIKLIDKKARGGGWRERWMSIDEDLAEALAKWQEERPAAVKNVFMQMADHHSGAIQVGDPFKQRRHFMESLCRRAGVKPFGFHALRHWGAARIFKAKGLNEAQMFMGHSRATTTDRYIRSAGLYADKEALATTISNSPVGAVAKAMLQKETAPDGAATVTSEQ